MAKPSYRKRKKPARTPAVLLLIFVVVIGMRFAWNAVTSAQEAGSTPTGRTATQDGPVNSGKTPSDDHSKIRVVVDAGHGGKDPGATGAGGAYEKEYTLAMALRVYDLLAQDPLFEAQLTREDDRFIELEDRAAIANAWDADALVSIHGNTFEDPDISGTETLYFSDESLPLAQTLQGQISAALELRDRGLKQGAFVVLQAAHMPAVIVEIGYMTNPDEERKMLSLKGQERAAEAIYEGIKAYFHPVAP